MTDRFFFNDKKDEITNFDLVLDELGRDWAKAYLQTEQAYRFPGYGVYGMSE